MDLDVEAVKAKIAALKTEHRELDEQIAKVEQGAGDGIRLQKMKRRKLALKDQIAKLESQLLPDIIA
ncbi:MAG TPA: DUF465 domain-containing protein [Stellaceae bacterium]|jgi:hypothetical protein